jgi:hypothetical protein
MFSLPIDPLLPSLCTAADQHLHPCRTTGSAEKRTKQQVQHTSASSNHTYSLAQAAQCNTPQTAAMPQTTTIKCNA